MSKKLNIHFPAPASKSYTITLSKGLFEQVPSWLPKNHHPLVIITDHQVKKKYGIALAQHLRQHGHTVLLLSFPAGEKHKNHQTKSYLEEKMLRKHCGRETLILALGGGVVGDMAGFIAATYMRGIAYLQLPTTLLAMVDSSIGGKTGIDTPHGKNLIGAFWQPQAVVIDTQCLNSLSQKHLINGLFEVLKMFLTNDKKSFYFLQKHWDTILVAETNVIENIIQRALKIKAEIVQQDEKEMNIRMILNFGHTIGHALEQISHYKIEHGYAVGYGILVEAKISQLMGILTPDDYGIIESVLQKMGIFGKKLKTFSLSQILRATKTDKKVQAGQVHYVLLSAIGAVSKNKQKFTYSVTDSIVTQAWSMVIEESYVR